MNERIQQLVKRASTTTTSYYDGRGNVTETYFDKEKFTHLIVKECTNYLNEQKFADLIVQECIDIIAPYTVRMNERTTKLAEEAWDATAVSPYFGHPVSFAEKFAMLIVSECAGIYDAINNGNLHLGTDDYLEALIKHFGVKE